MENVAVSHPMEVVAVVVGDVERLNEELVGAGSHHPLGTAVEVVGELPGVEHHEHAVPELAQPNVAHVGLVELPG
jgi:hypothetical protein